jgi:hypothetical protein
MRVAGLRIRRWGYRPRSFRNRHADRADAVHHRCAAHPLRRNGEELHRYLEHLGAAAEQAAEEMLIRQLVGERHAERQRIGGSHRPHRRKGVGDVAAVEGEIQQAEGVAAGVTDRGMDRVVAELEPIGLVDVAHR